MFAPSPACELPAMPAVAPIPPALPPWPPSPAVLVAPPALAATAAAAAAAVAAVEAVRGARRSGPGHIAVPAHTAVARSVVGDRAVGARHVGDLERHATTASARPAVATRA